MCRDLLDSVHFPRGFGPVLTTINSLSHAPHWFSAIYYTCPCPVSRLHQGSFKDMDWGYKV